MTNEERKQWERWMDRMSDSEAGFDYPSHGCVHVAAIIILLGLIAAIFFAL